MTDNGFALLERFNRTLRELDRVYHEMARTSGLSDCAFWTMYALYGAEEPLPQKEISQTWQYSKQTVASALQQLVRRGLVQVRLAEGSRRDKVIELTDEGLGFARRHLLPVAQAEQAALAGLGAEGAEELLDRLDGYTSLLGTLADERGLCGA
ncbi:winged helix DNA-binding protein [Bifidobacterium pullorum subsp. saeculare]|uniref:Winged helix DNA-binding protein n=1 Tax=Bifidobacterium pullorum subsp. saeculare TaxID=78257 RepID=A0A938WVI5_9BIFI|nr:MarR family transcriptional regulator [Bifidobacterium pullorum]MBM6699550.1 winged helix DNA-binding protein [Bifidobacterium pullorum subsp. saeculare]